MEQFINALKSYGPLPIEDVEKIKKAAVRLDVKKGAVIQTIHHPVDQLLFVEKGLIMGFLFGKKSRIIKWLSKEAEFVILLKSIFGQEELDKLGVEALEDSIIWTLSGEVIDSMVGPGKPFSEQYLRISMDHVVATEERLRLLSLKDANEWYTHMRQTAPSLLTRVPRGLLASYMRIPERDLTQVMKNKNGLVKMNMMIRRRRGMWK